MKHLFAILVLGIVTARAVDYPVKEDAKRVADLLGKDWTIATSGTAIVITSKFKVTNVIIMSRAYSPPKFSDSTPWEKVAGEGITMPYVIRLEYEPSLSDAELAKRIGQRQVFADMLTFGVHHKGDWARAMEGFHAIRVPRYRGFDFCIYRILPEHFTTIPYPPSAASKIGGAKELLDILFRQMRNAYE